MDRPRVQARRDFAMAKHSLQEETTIRDIAITRMRNAVVAYHAAERERGLQETVHELVALLAGYQAEVERLREDVAAIAAGLRRRSVTHIPLVIQLLDKALAREDGGS